MSGVALFLSCVLCMEVFLKQTQNFTDGLGQVAENAYIFRVLCRYSSGLMDWVLRNT